MASHSICKEAKETHAVWTNWICPKAGSTTGSTTRGCIRIRCKRHWLIIFVNSPGQRPKGVWDNQCCFLVLPPYPPVDPGFQNYIPWWGIKSRNGFVFRLFYQPKKSWKNGPLKNLSFFDFGPTLGRPLVQFSRFWGARWVPGRTFLHIFWSLFFDLDFGAIFIKKNKKTKNEKVGFDM